MPDENLDIGLYRVIVGRQSGTEAAELKIVVKLGTNHYIREFLFEASNEEK